jgi:hypothetical protein
MKNFYKFVFFGGSVIALLVIINVVSAEDILLSSVEVPEHLHLKASKDRVLGSIESNGVVKYAYRSDVRLDSSASPEVIKRATERGLQVRGEVLSKRTKHARTFETSKPGTYVAEIISGVPQYYKDNNGGWWQAEYATTTKEAFDQQVAKTLGERFAEFLLPSTHADSSTFFPCPDPESSCSDAYDTVDGWTKRDVGGQGELWTSLHGGSGNSTLDNETNSYYAVRVGTTQTSNQYDIISLSIYLFDTSSLDSAADIQSATFSVYPTAKLSTMGGSLVLTNANPASTTALAADDYTNRGSNMSTEYGSSRLNFSSVSTGTYNAFSLNATGLANIDKAGITKLGLRASQDFDNSPGTWTSTLASYIDANYSEATGTSTDPTLVVVYSQPDPSFIQFEVRKDLDESVASSASLQADDQLLLGLGANKTYSIEGVIFASSTSATPDIQIGLDFSPGIVADVGAVAAGDSEIVQHANVASPRLQVATSGTAIKISGTISMGNASSTITLLWSQAASNGNATKVLRGSYLRAEELQ